MSIGPRRRQAMNVRGPPSLPANRTVAWALLARAVGVRRKAELSKTIGAIAGT
jgi:hypothetical protein